ncbi:Friend of PRMT1 duplication [Phytophthora cactorum]|nr:Friend of PRMT1 duplication [Phytophthora cactorum]
MYRRSGAPRASVRGQRKINQQHPQAQGKRRRVPRFTNLADETTPRQAQKQHKVAVVKMPQKKGKAQPIQQQKQKLQQVAQNNRNKRQQVVSKHRKGLAPQEAKPKGSQNKNKNAPNKQNGGRGAGRGGRRSRWSWRGGRGGRGDAKAKPPTGEDLDMEMDEYWHDAGKGPDPKAVQLDRQMEDYWAAKPTQDNTATKTEAEPAPIPPWSLEQ